MTCRFKVRRRARSAMASTSAIFLLFAVSQSISAADKLIGIDSARVLSQSMPWVATEAGLFKKYQLDFELVLIASSPSVTAAMLGGDAEISLAGGEGPIRAYVQRASDFVFVAGFKNMLTHSASWEEMEKERLFRQALGKKLINWHYSHQPPTDQVTKPGCSVSRLSGRGL
jgi:hypothetical protein